MKILCVCLGNICRSPMAEGIFKKLVHENNLDWEVRSAGTNRHHKGDPADSRTVTACQAQGLDIRSHIARRLRSVDFDHYDVIFTMAGDVTEEMQEFIRSNADRKKVVNFLDVLYPGEERSVPDPWYGGMKDFHECYKLVHLACEAWVEKFRK